MQLDKSSDIPLYRQLSDILANKIKELPPASKLPTIRSLAKSFDINNATVVSAYKFLESRDIVYSVIGSGFYTAKAEEPQPQFALSDCINFADSTVDKSLFPSKDFQAAAAHAINAKGVLAFEVTNQEKNSHFTQSVTHAIDNITHALISPSDTILIEGPTLLFTALRCKVIYFEPGDISKISSLITRHSPKLIIISSDFGLQTGGNYSLFEKKELLNLANSRNFHIIEIDMSSDFFYGTDYRTDAPVLLHALDMHNNTTYVKSFANILAGFQIVKTLSPIEITNLHPAPIFMQNAFKCYMEQGSFLTHADNMRREYTRRYNKLIHACTTYLSSQAVFSAPLGGLGIWVSPLSPIQEDFHTELLTRKVITQPGAMFTPEKPHSFRINFANVNAADIARGIGIISSVLRH